MGELRWGTGAAALLLAACGEPQPGLVTPEREAQLDRCETVLAQMASGESQLKALCDCSTAKLASQGLKLADLQGARRDRAREAVRWCMSQTGAAPQGRAPTPETGPADTSDAKAAASRETDMSGNEKTADTADAAPTGPGGED